MSEERRTAKDGKVYTKPEFQEWYGEDADTHFNEANPLLASDVSDANPDSSTSAAPAAPTLGFDSLTDAAGSGTEASSGLKSVQRNQKLQRTQKCVAAAELEAAASAALAAEQKPATERSEHWMDRVVDDRESLRGPGRPHLVASAEQTESFLSTVNASSVTPMSLPKGFYRESIPDAGVGPDLDSLTDEQLRRSYPPPTSGASASETPAAPPAPAAKAVSAAQPALAPAAGKAAGKAASPAPAAPAALPAPSDSDANPDASSSAAPAAPTVLAVPAAPHVLLQLNTKKEMQRHILHPLREQIGGDFPDWILPVRLDVGGIYVQLPRLQEVIDLDYNSIFGPVLHNLHVAGWTVEFYEEEPDSTPPFAKDRPRLDILITFTDGTWLRWHPHADLIWSTTPQPTDAMKIRMNRKKKLLKQMRPAQ